MSPESVAFLGVSSTNRGSYANLALRNLIESGYSGGIYPIHPSVSELEGLPAYSSITDVPTTPDVCFVAVPAAAVPDTLRECASAGVGNAILIGSGFAESGTADGIALQNEIVEVSRDSDMRILGPNTIGVANFPNHMVNVATANMPKHVLTGTVAVISQSGSIGTTLMAAAERLGVGLQGFIALGNEADISASEAVTYFAQNGASAILCYLETIRDPASFGEACALSSNHSVPVVILKGGTQPAGQAAAAAHTAALAGSTRILDEIFGEWGVSRVTSPEALIYTGALFSSFGAAPGSRFGLFGNGGGNGTLLADAIDRADICLSEIDSLTTAHIKSILWDSNGSNPLDVGGWFLSRGPELMEQALRHFVNDPGIDVLAYGVVPMLPGREEVYIGSISRVSKDSSKPAICLSSHSTLTDFRLKSFKEAGVLELPCLDAACEALAIWTRWSDRDIPDDVDVLPPLPELTVSPEIERQLTGSGGDGSNIVLLEDRAATILGQMGVPFPPWRVVPDAATALAVAEELGYPLVVKAIAEGLHHRAQVGAIATGIQDGGSLVSAVERVLNNARVAVGSDVPVCMLLAREIGQGIELIAGIQRDPVFGPVVMIGLGGIWSEVLDDVAFAEPPITEPKVRRMLSRLRSYPQLARAADSSLFDMDALISLMITIGRVADALGPMIRTVDLNPVIVGSEGAVVVDALIESNSGVQMHPGS
jgi:acyl-CoA synthetase (NDP forming)